MFTMNRAIEPAQFEVAADAPIAMEESTVDIDTLLENLNSTGGEHSSRIDDIEMRNLENIVRYDHVPNVFLRKYNSNGSRNLIYFNF